MAHPYVALVVDGKRIDEHRLLAGCKDAGIDVVVHHVDGDKRNNVADNLEVLTRSEHAKHHGLGVQIRPWPLFGPDESGMAECRKCGLRIPFDQFPKAGSKTKSGRESMCRSCRSLIRKQRKLRTA
jgi:hypothetical protein